MDPLPADHVFNTVLKPSTTFLIGRKGTEKPEFFSAFSTNCVTRNGYASAYVDIKTVFESSSTDPAPREQLGSDTLAPDEIKKLLLYRAFIKAVINEIREEIKKKLKESAWEWIKNAFTASAAELFESLDDLLERADQTEFASVLGIW